MLSTGLLFLDRCVCAGLTAIRLAAGVLLYKHQHFQSASIPRLRGKNSLATIKSILKPFPYLRPFLLLGWGGSFSEGCTSGEWSPCFCCSGFEHSPCLVWRVFLGISGYQCQTDLLSMGKLGMDLPHWQYKRFVFHCQFNWLWAHLL